MKYASFAAFPPDLYLLGTGRNQNAEFYKITFDHSNRALSYLLELPPFIKNVRGACLALLPLQNQLLLFGGRADVKLTDTTYVFDTRKSCLYNIMMLEKTDPIHEKFYFVSVAITSAFFPV
jgi:hypothetical protein